MAALGQHGLPALVMEYAHGGPLNLILSEYPALSPSTLLDWAVQIATGMAYLHTGPRLFHRDLKTSNSESVQTTICLSVHVSIHLISWVLNAFTI